MPMQIVNSLPGLSSAVCEDSHPWSPHRELNCTGDLPDSLAQLGQVLSFCRQQVKAVVLWDNKGVPLGKGMDVEKGDAAVVLKNTIAG